ncbi:MAG: hypothetical protein ACREL1_09260 [bacterium]
MKKTWGLAALLMVAILCAMPWACSSSKSAPVGPSGGGSGTDSPTPTVTVTTTPTPTPDCASVPDISPAINALAVGGVTDIMGDDTIGMPGLDLEGFGPTGSLFGFQVNAAVTLHFSLCATENPPNSDRDMWMAIRAGSCGSRVDLVSNDDSCDLLPQLPAFYPTPGVNYYVVAADAGPGSPFKMRVLSGPVPGAVQMVSPVSTPQTTVQGNQLSCAAAFNLGTLGTGDSAAEGSIEDEVYTDDYYQFQTQNNGGVTVTLDSYDNGLNQADFEIFIYDDCPDSSSNFIGSSTTPGATSQQFIFTAAAGGSYIVDVNAAFGAGPYRLTLQTP